MPFKLTRTAALLLACAIVIPATGCARNKSSSDTAYIARDVNSLYALAKQRMDNQRYEEAAKLFDEVERQHPYSVWARRAQLMSAFSYYMAQKYPEAISSSQRFLTIHPGNKDAPYAHYLIAMSHYQQIEDVTRDQASTANALNAFGELMRRYPDSRYVPDARQRMIYLRNNMARSEIGVALYYLRIKAYVAAANRAEKIVENYQRTPQAGDALAVMAESYGRLGQEKLSGDARRVLELNYPEHPYLKGEFPPPRRSWKRIIPFTDRS